MRKFFCLLSVLIFIQALNAVPARRATFSATSADGKQLMLRTVGNENHHWFVATDGNVYSRDALGNFVEKTEKPASGPSKARKKVTPMDNSTRCLPTSGSPRIPVLLVDFTDVKFSMDDPKATFETLINTGSKSVAQYFSDMSGGTFTPQFDILGPYSMRTTQAYYGENNSDGNDIRGARFVRDCISASRSQINFADYDNDGDGQCDFLYVIFAGVGEATASVSDPQSLWPRKSSFAENNMVVSLPNVCSFNHYAYSNELVDGQVDGIGTFVHEFCHALGLPDLGSVGSSNDIYGMDEWSVMDYGCYLDGGKTPCALSGFERSLLGWTDFMPVEKMRSYTLQTAANGGKPVKITNPANENEFYVLENRQQTGWDTYLSSHGMMITHIDYDADLWASNQVNTDPDHKRMTIVPADDDLSIESNSGDLWPNEGLNDAFTDTSNPAAFTFTGNKLEKPVEQIREEGGTISFFYDNGADTPILGLFEPEDITAYSLRAKWSEANGWRSYSLRLWPATPEDTSKVFIENFASLVASDEDISNRLNAYTATPGWTGFNLFPEDGGLRVGSVGNVGTIISPKFDASRVDGKVTVSFAAQPYGFDGDVVVRIELLNAAGNIIQDYTVTSSTARICHVFTDAQAGSRVKISTIAARKRVIISDIAILVGDFSATYSAPQYRENDYSEQDGVITIDDIHALEYRVVGLDANTVYNVQVDVHHVGTLILSSNIRMVRTLEAPVLRLGDVNGDGFVDVGDVVTLANFVMGDPVDPFYRSAADLNDDKQIDVGDVVALAQMVMGEDTSSD